MTAVDPYFTGESSRSDDSPTSPEAFGWGGYFQAIGAVFLILALFVLGFYLMRRFGPTGRFGSFGRGDLRLEESVHIGPKKSIVVVRFLNRKLVLGVTDANINLLTETFEDHDDTTDFATSMENADKSRGAS